MASFFVYDIIFLIVFSIFVALFLYLKRKNLNRDGIIFLYRTKIGIRAINYIGNNCKKTLNVLKYVIIGAGIMLTAGMLYILGQAVYIYAAFPQITKLIKAPPIAPLIPYFPKIFGLQSFFPDFYFTYFLIALVIVAVVHEFSHGIFMKLFKIKIKSTGFVFLGPVLGAFVEQDDKQMRKKKNSEQMAVLGAGTFANAVFALIFFGILVGFFSLFFAPSGYIISAYPQSAISIDKISGFSNYSNNLTIVHAGENIYFLDKNLKAQLEMNLTNIIVYDNAPAVKAGLKGIIYEIDGEKILNQEGLQNFLLRKKPGEEIEIQFLYNKEIKTISLTLDKNPGNESKPYIGIASIPQQTQGIIGKFLQFFMGFKNYSTYYSPKFDGDLIFFIYYLLWWIMVINLLVAFFNMLPLGILDGGRFFYLAILSITKSEKVAKSFLKIINYLILFLFFFIMVLWALNFF